MRCRKVPRHRIETNAPPSGPAAENRAPAASANWKELASLTGADSNQFLLWLQEMNALKQGLNEAA
jgi:hypothetical protein